MDEERLNLFKNVLLITTRIAGIIATILFFTIHSFAHYVSPKVFIRDVKSDKCFATEHTNEIKTEVVPNLKTTYEGIYSIVEYKLFNESLEYNEEHVAYYKRKHLKYWKPWDIPVLLIPQFADPPDFYVPLAKIVHSRTKNHEFRFRWYTMTFNGSIPETYFTRMDYYGAAIRDAAEYIRSTNRSQESILIGRDFAGFRAFSTALQYHLNNISNAPDLVIMESTALRRPGYYDREMGLMMKQHTEQWIEKANKSPIGVISFDAGVNDTTVNPNWWKLPRVELIPVWTIDGVPDSGLSETSMSRCEPLLNVITDLIVTYGYRHKRRGGKAIVESFIDEWETIKQGPLPFDWKEDNYKETLRIQIGYRYEFVINGSRWIELDVQRNNAFLLDITGTCLTSATLIRRRKFIKRKEQLIEYAFFEFGIYQ